MTIGPSTRDPDTPLGRRPGEFGRGGYSNAQPAKSYFGLFILAAALSENGQSAKSKLFTARFSLIPSFKIKDSAAATANFLMLLVIIIDFIPTIEHPVRPRLRPSFDFGFC